MHVSKGVVGGGGWGGGRWQVAGGGGRVVGGGRWWWWWWYAWYACLGCVRVHGCVAVVVHGRLVGASGRMVAGCLPLPTT